MAVYPPVLTGLLVGATLLGGLAAVGIALVSMTVVLVVALRFGRYASMIVDSPAPEVFPLRVLGTALVVAGIASQLQVSAAVGAFLLGRADLWLHRGERHQDARTAARPARRDVLRGVTNDRRRRY